MFYCATIFLSIPSLRMVGYIVSSVAILFMIFAVVARSFLTWKIKRFEIPLVFLVLWYLFLSFIHRDFDGLYQTLQLLFVILAFMYSVRYGNCYPGLILTYINLLLLIVAGADILIGNQFNISLAVRNHQKSIYSNPNVTGAIVFLVLTNSMLADLRHHKVLKNLLFLLGILLVILSQSRSVYLGVFAFGVTWAIYPRLKSKGLQKGFFLGVVVLLGGFLYLYAKQSYLIDFLNNGVFRLTNKNFYSGREQFWGYLITDIIHEPFFGYGPSATPFKLIDVPLSSHNLYLQIGIQSGIPGIVLIIIFFYRLFLIFVRSSSSDGQLGAAIVMFTMIHQMFEVSLTQNNLGIGLLVWLPLGILCSRLI